MELLLSPTAAQAVKPLYQSLRANVRGHSVSALLERLPRRAKPASKLVLEAKLLDRHYIPTRYPNSHPKERLWTIIRDRTHNKQLGLPGASYDTVRIEYAVPKKRVEKALELYLERIRSKIQLSQAILFGSYAKGNYSSDIDIAIVADHLPQNETVRYALLKESILGRDLQPFAYTVAEWREMAETKSGFQQDILKHGKILYPPRPRTRRRVAQAS